jgi:FkbM family methyltransferase
MTEAFVTDYIKNLEYTDQIALDIGANHGIYTKLLSKKFKTVYAFEPHPDNVKFLQEETAVCNNVIIVNKAISNVTDKIKLWTCKTCDGMHTINPAPEVTEHYGRKPDEFIEVDAIRLDDFCKDFPVAFIKMDIETAEDFVWNGAVDTLKNNKLNIILETHQEVDILRLATFFTELGYDIEPGLCADTHSLISNLHKEE